jgi:hypothetical protein
MEGDGGRKDVVVVARKFWWITSLSCDLRQLALSSRSIYFAAKHGDISKKVFVCFNNENSQNNVKIA